MKIQSSFNHPHVDAESLVKFRSPKNISGASQTKKKKKSALQCSPEIRWRLVLKPKKHNRKTHNMAPHSSADIVQVSSSPDVPNKY